ncbi:MAG: cadherin-like beta sandwich domain-containing protein, partial [Deltaproteobacteria bacterium]
MSDDIALNKPVTASSYLLPYSPKWVVDGEKNVAVRRWVTTKLPASMTVDLGEYYWIDHIILTHMGWIDESWASRYNVQKYAVLGSTDNTQWTQLFSISGSTSKSDDKTFKAQPARWVRFNVDGGEGLTINPDVASLVAMEVYENPANPYLSGLVISSGTLIPAFAKKTFDYSATVEYSVNTLSVTPTASSTKSVITVDDKPLVNGSYLVTLKVGPNTVTVKVKAGQIEQSYIINVTRMVEKVVYLTGLEIKNSGGPVELQPIFQQEILKYDIDDNSSVKVKPSCEEGNLIKVNGTAVNSGVWSQAIETDIFVEVSPSAGGSTTQYTISRQHSAIGPYLTGLEMADSKGTDVLAPPFDPTTLNYSAEANDWVRFRPYCDAGNVITVNGKQIASGAWSEQI